MRAVRGFETTTGRLGRSTERYMCALILTLFLAHPVAAAAPPTKAASGVPTLAVFELHYGGPDAAVLQRTQSYATQIAEVLAASGDFDVKARADAAEVMSQTFPRPQGGDVDAQLTAAQSLFKDGESLFFEGKVAGALERVEQASFKMDQVVTARALTDPMRQQFIATELLLAQLYLRDDDKTKAENVMEGVVRRVGDDASITTDTYHPEQVKLFKAVQKRLETARNGQLTVQSEPAGADILVNGVRQTGQTPTTLDPLYTGPQTIQVVIADNVSRAQRVFVPVAGESPQVLKVDLPFDQALQLESDAFGVRFVDVAARDKDIARFAAQLGQLVGVDYVALVGLRTQGASTHLEGFLIHVATADVVREAHANAAVSLTSRPTVVDPTRVSQMATFLQTGEGPSNTGSPWYTNTLGWVLTGAGVAATVVGAVLYGSYLDNRDIAECDPAAAGSACKPLAAREVAKDDAEGNRTVAYALWGVGAGSIVGGILVFALHDDGDSDSADAGDTASEGLRATTLAPTITPDGGVGLSAGFSF
ncbi:MAG: hypothetical protein ACI9MR_002445 [Myxococcota bacterium]|jgi:hypothetical protein